MSQFVQGFLHRALHCYRAVSRQSVELLLQTRNRQERHPAAQLGLAIDETQHGDEQIAFRDPQKPDRVRGTGGDKLVQDRDRSELAADTVERIPRLREGRKADSLKLVCPPQTVLHGPEECFLHFSDREDVDRLHTSNPVSATGSDEGVCDFPSTGSVTRNVVPFPTALSTSISPSWELTTP